MSGSPAAEGRRVVVIDDNTSLAENLCEILTDAGYEAHSAGTVRTGIEKAREGFDVALIDLQLPDGNGAKLAAELKKEHPEREVVLLTGFASFESAQAAISTGAFAYLIKPCAAPEILLTVGQAMRQVRLRAEKKELTRRALVSEKLASVGTMTAGLSHEIRNPLNSAGLQLAVLDRRIQALPENLRAPLMQPLGLVRDEIRRLDHILEDFLQFARPREFVPGSVSISGVIQRVAQFMQGDAERRRITLEISGSETIPWVNGEEGRLRQVLMNLTLNAFDATPEGGKVRLTTRVDGEDVIVTVEDSGSGIPPEVQERIFEPFFTTKAAGSGLGLPIVNAIVIQHGGSIAIGSSPLGGASFAVRLPRLAERTRAGG